MFESPCVQVGFASLDLQVSDVRSGHCDGLVSRTGLYGDVTVLWRAGFPPGQTPSGYQPGAITPSSGEVSSNSDNQAHRYSHCGTKGQIIIKIKKKCNASDKDLFIMYVSIYVVDIVYTFL